MTVSAAAFETFAALLKARSGLAIGPDKAYLLEARLAALLRRLDLGSLDALAARLRLPAQDALAAEVVEAMTTNESFFFRDDKPFAHFRAHALPRLCAARPAGLGLRIWSAAAATGQEAYSIAMLIAEHRATLAGRPVTIIGTDIARAPLERARAGLYTQFEVQRGLPMTMLVRHFRKEAAGFRVRDELRTAVEFREFNLLGDLRPLGRFDVVFCRNVLIYFDAPTKTRVLAAIAAQMPPDGILYLGGAETLFGITDRFATIPGEPGAYRPAPAQATPLRAAG